jgi:hypothetical protein
VLKKVPVVILIPVPVPVLVAVLKGGTHTVAVRCGAPGTQFEREKAAPEKQQGMVDDPKTNATRHGVVPL